jgi:hypothetical protein
MRSFVGGVTGVTGDRVGPHQALTRAFGYVLHHGGGNSLVGSYFEYARALRIALKASLSAVDSDVFATDGALVAITEQRLRP